MLQEQRNPKSTIPIRSYCRRICVASGLVSEVKTRDQNYPLIQNEDPTKIKAYFIKVYQEYKLRPPQTVATNTVNDDSLDKLWRHQASTLPVVGGSKKFSFL